MKEAVVQRIQPLYQPGLAASGGTSVGAASDPSPSAKTDGLTLVQKGRSLTANTDSPPAHTCQQCLWISVFFDGTGNNRDADLPTLEHSNVARLSRAHPDSPKMGVVPIYIPGIGTPFPEIGDDGTGPIPFIDLSKAVGARGQGRLDETFRRITKAVTDAEARAQNPTNKIVWIKLAVFGFSRGATLARAFVRDLLDPKKGKTLQAGRDLQWKGAQGRYPLSIEFMGLFDTVASVGAPLSANNVKAVRNVRRTNTNIIRLGWEKDRVQYMRAQDLAFGAPGTDPSPGSADGHSDWADGLAIPEAVKQCVHFIAAHEFRNSFPVDSVMRGASKPANCKEMVYPGAHSNVGGGYRPGEGGQGSAAAKGASTNATVNMLSLIPLRAMYDEAVRAGVPLAKIGSTQWKPINTDDFRTDPMLIDFFNHYRSQVGAGGRTLGTEMLAHSRMYFAWRWYRIAQGRQQQLAQLQKNEAVFKQDHDALTQRRRLLSRNLQQKQAQIRLREQRLQHMQRPTGGAALLPSASAQSITEEKTNLQALRIDAERLQAEIDVIDAQLNTAPGTGSLTENLNEYDAELLVDVRSILAEIQKDPAKRGQLRPHYRNLVETYEAEFVHKRGLSDPKIIAFFDNHVHDSLAEFATDSTLPSDPRVIYVGNDNKLRYASAPKQTSSKDAMTA
jgi:hypothetical protein